MAQTAMTRVMEQISKNLKSSYQKDQDLQMRKEKSYVQTLYKCDKCRDTGWILKPMEHAQPLAVMCECRKKNKVKEQWKACGINPEMINYKFSNFKVWNEVSQRMRDTAISYINDFDNIKKTRRNSFMLCGQVGCGKTHLSIAVAINMINSGKKVVYMPYRDVITKIKQNMLDDDYYSKSISKLQTCEVLLIDDLFKGKVTESDVNIMFEIINYRYLNYLPIIISSEFSIDMLLNFDEGVGSRIFEMCRNYLVEIERDDKTNFRLRKLFLGE